MYNDMVIYLKHEYSYFVNGCITTSDSAPPSCLLSDWAHNGGCEKQSCLQFGFKSRSSSAAAHLVVELGVLGVLGRGRPGVPEVHGALLAQQRLSRGAVLVAMPVQAHLAFHYLQGKPLTPFGMTILQKLQEKSGCMYHKELEEMESTGGSVMYPFYSCY